MNQKSLLREIRSGNKEASLSLIKENAGFISELVNQYKKKTEINEAIKKAAERGMIKAVLAFDMEGDSQFLSFSVWFIRNEIVKEISGI